VFEVGVFHTVIIRGQEGVWGNRVPVPRVALYAKRIPEKNGIAHLPA
jgi:hypothetical protein